MVVDRHVIALVDAFVDAFPNWSVHQINLYKPQPNNYPNWGSYPNCSNTIVI